MQQLQHSVEIRWIDERGSNLSNDLWGSKFCSSYKRHKMNHGVQP